jgi:hypothetical protein
MKYFVIIIFSTLLIACNRSGSPTNSVGISDTIRVSNMQVGVTPEVRAEYLNHFYSRFGVVIPKYYLVVDSLALDLNSDGFIDTLMVLSPISLEEVEHSNLQIETTPKRLLVEILNMKGISKLRNIYENLISDIGGSLSKYNGLKPTECGFEINHTSGSKYSWSYSTVFSTKSKDSLQLLKIKKTCAYDGKEKNIEYVIDNRSIKNINVQDTINANCNCDALWESISDRRIDEKNSASKLKK